MPLSPQDWHHRFQIQSQWTRDTRLHLYNRLGTLSGKRVLDVGCGTGVLSQELNQLSGEEIIGLDFNIDFLEIAASQSPSNKLVLADAHTMPFKADAIDCSVCHYLLLWVDNPSMVINEMVRVTKPGGAVLALAEPDYGGRIDYPQEFSILGEIQESALHNQGADPLMGRKLSGLLHQSGLTEIEVGVIGAQWYGIPSENHFDSEWEILQSDLESLNENSEVIQTPEDLRQAELASWASGERILYVPTFYAWGRVSD